MTSGSASSRPADRLRTGRPLGAVAGTLQVGAHHHGQGRLVVDDEHRRRWHLVRGRHVASLSDRRPGRRGPGLRATILRRFFMEPELQWLRRSMLRRPGRPAAPDLDPEPGDATHASPASRRSSSPHRPQPRHHGRRSAAPRLVRLPRRMPTAARRARTHVRWDTSTRSRRTPAAETSSWRRTAVCSGSVRPGPRR